MAAANEVRFDYEQSKALYMAQVKKCFDEDSTHSERTIQKTIEVLNSSVKTYLRKNYEVSYSFGREILIEKRKLPTDPIVHILNFEDVFDIFIKYHIGNNHMGGRQHLLEVEKNFRISYKFPVVCLSLLVKNCNVCKSRSWRPVATVNKVSSVYVTVMIQKKKYADFRYLLIYIDKATDFVVLRPLKQRTDLEISTEIFKILMQFGPPQKLFLYGYNRDFNKRVGSTLRQVCPMFDFAIEYKSANFDPSAVVMDKLNDWMNQNGSLMWEVGCSIVQRELNMSPKHKIHQSEDINDLSPHDLFYGNMHNNEDELPTIQKDIQTYNEGMDRIGRRALGNSVINVVTHPNDNVFERFETRISGAVPHYRNLETTVDVDEVVELRIPSPENYELDLLSQFEDSEISQELIGDMVQESKKANGKPQKASEAVVDNFSMSILRIQDDSQRLFKGAITSNKKKELVEHIITGKRKPANKNLIKTYENKIKTKQALHPVNDSAVLIPNNSLASVIIETTDIPVLDCEVFSDSEVTRNLELLRDRVDNKEDGKDNQEHINRKYSLRSAKTVDVSMEKSTEDIIQIDDEEEIEDGGDDEELIFNPDEEMRNEEDPLNMDEESTLT